MKQRESPVFDTSNDLGGDWMEVMGEAKQLVVC
jgi:hypothetical protein